MLQWSSTPGGRWVECEFPLASPGTAYNRGCRCVRCKENRRRVVEKSKDKKWEARNPGMRKRYPVPSELILGVLEKWLAEVGAKYDDAFEGLGQELGIKQTGAMRMMSRLRNKETTYMGFNKADKIICSLFGPHYWYEHEDLYAIYEEHA